MLLTNDHYNADQYEQGFDLPYFGLLYYTYL